jgi:hypothetical protein
MGCSAGEEEGRVTTPGRNIIPRFFFFFFLFFFSFGTFRVLVSFLRPPPWFPPFSTFFFFSFLLIFLWFCVSSPLALPVVINETR